jgi:hypothetical protein
MYHQWCTNTVRQDVMTIKSCTLVPKIWGLQCGTTFHVTLLVPRTVWWLLGPWKFFAPLCTTHFNIKWLFLYRFLVTQDKSDFSKEDILFCFVN